MPITLNVGLTKELGLPNRGSLLVSCGIELSLDETLALDDAAGLRHQARRIYAACRQAVDEELARQKANQGVDRANGRANGDVSSSSPLAAPTVSNHRAEADSPAATDRHPLANGHSASGKQLEYIRRLASQVEGLGVGRLDVLAKRLCGKGVAEFQGYDASRMIETLKAAKAGQIDLEVVLQGRQ
jgi:hypothetical protein